MQVLSVDGTFFREQLALPPSVRRLSFHSSTTITAERLHPQLEVGHD